MKLFVGITDYDWYRLHASKLSVEEVNFWRPSPDATFKAVRPGERPKIGGFTPRTYSARE